MRPMQTAVPHGNRAIAASGLGFSVQGLELRVRDGYSRTSVSVCVCELSRVSLRVEVPNNQIITQNLYYNPSYPKPKRLIIGYLDPLSFVSCASSGALAATQHQGKKLHGGYQYQKVQVPNN